MKALIVTAHGSRRAESNNEFIQIVEKVKALFDPSEYSVTHAFLEIEPPFLSEQLPLVIAQGYSTIDIFPYFLNAGTHVDRDIPQIISKVQSHNPHCAITQLPYIGSFHGMAELIFSQIR